MYSLPFLTEILFKLFRNYFTCTASDSSWLYPGSYPTNCDRDVLLARPNSRYSTCHTPPFDTSALNRPIFTRPTTDHSCTRPINQCSFLIESRSEFVRGQSSVQPRSLEDVRKLKLRAVRYFRRINIDFDARMTWLFRWTRISTIGQAIRKRGMRVIRGFIITSPRNDETKPQTAVKKE